MKKVIRIALIILISTNITTVYAISDKGSNSAKISLIKMVNCVRKNDQLAMVENESKTYSNEYVSVNINKPIVKIPGNKRVEEIINNKISKKVNDFEENISDLSKKDNEFNVKNGLEVRPYVVNINNTVSYNAGNILSLTLHLYSYTGGAHGSSVDISYNFDTNTGNSGVLEDFFGNNENYNKIILDNIKATIKNNQDLYFKEVTDNINEIPYNQKFYITDKGLVVYFDEYEIAPYAAGIPSFNIPFDKFPKGLNKVDIQFEAPIIKYVNYENSTDNFNEYLSYPRVENLTDKIIEEKINNYFKNEISEFSKGIKEKNINYINTDKYIKGITTYFMPFFKDKYTMIFDITYSGNNSKDKNILLYNKKYKVNLQNGDVIIIK